MQHCRAKPQLVQKVAGARVLAVAMPAQRYREVAVNMANPGQRGSQIPYNDKVDQDTWDADTQSIAQTSKQFDSLPDSALPPIDFTPQDEN